MNRVSQMIVVLLALLLSGSVSAMEIVDLTTDDMIKRRQALIANGNNPGMRIHMGEMKQMNKLHGIGSVNAAILNYEQHLVKGVDQLVASNPEMQVSISKSDFKGYYVSCRPDPQCLKPFQSFMDRGPQAIKLPNGGGLSLTTTKASSYTKAYIKTRVMKNYPGYDGKNPSLEKFLQKKMVEANRVGKVPLGVLEENISILRRKGMGGVEPSLRKMVVLLDSMEVPFAGANNLDVELDRALKTNRGTLLGNGFSLSTAQSGDDLYIVIKDKSNKAIKVVGADVRGLGVANMSARYEEFLDIYRRTGKLVTLDDVVDLSTKGIYRADERMFASMRKYQEVLEGVLGNATNLGPSKIDELLELAHGRYVALSQEATHLMPIRGAAIDSCRTQNCLNKMTFQHNLLKEMEEMGVGTHFGDSCLGNFYWLRKIKQRKGIHF
jgi:hypothetical protein